jgi:hypothetical protein
MRRRSRFSVKILKIQHKVPLQGKYTRALTSENVLACKKKNRATYRAVFILADYILLQNRPTSRRGYYSYYVFIVDYHSFIHSERITTV